jgi:hypothetical protein
VPCEWIYAPVNRAALPLGEKRIKRLSALTKIAQVLPAKLPRVPF